MLNSRKVCHPEFQTAGDEVFCAGAAVPQQGLAPELKRTKMITRKELDHFIVVSVTVVAWYNPRRITRKIGGKKKGGPDNDPSCERAATGRRLPSGPSRPSRRARFVRERESLGRRRLVRVRPLGVPLRALKRQDARQGDGDDHVRGGDALQRLGELQLGQVVEAGGVKGRRSGHDAVQREVSKGGEHVRGVDGDGGSEQDCGEWERRDTESVSIEKETFGRKGNDLRLVPPSKRRPWTGFRTSLARAAPRAEEARMVKARP